MSSLANPDSARPGASTRRAGAHLAEIPGGSIYYRVEGHGPTLVLAGGGPSNADTLQPLANKLATDHTVVSYDRRGYSRSRLDHPGAPASIAQHADDLRRLIADLGPEPVSVFGTSFGALIALELAAIAPGSIETLIVHEPPLGQVLSGEHRQAFDLNLDAEPDAGSALNAIAASIGVTRGHLPATGVAEGSAEGSPAGRPGSNPADVELFIRRDAPAIGDYRLDLGRLSALSGRIAVTGSQDGRDFYPYQCALHLARHLGTSLIELPGNHAGMIQHPAEFAARLRALLPAS